MVEITALIHTNPKASIIVIGVVVSFFISLVNYFILDKDKMKEIKDKQKKVQAEIKIHQKAGNTAKMMELNKELMGHSMETFRHSFKPMLITMIPILVIFGALKGVYAETSLGGAWIWYYIGAAIISSIVFRKLFKLP